MDNNIEIWRDIQGYEGLYQVSNLGRVKSLDRIIRTKAGWEQKHKGHILQPRIKKNGYLFLILYKNNQGKNKYIHRLVAQAFLSNPKSLPTVNHKDGNKQNNNVNNLEWNSYSENNQHAYNHGLTHSNKNNPHMSKKVKVYSLTGKLKYEFPSMREAARKLNINASYIGQSIQHGWKCHNMIFNVDNNTKK